jgi:S1-C subfamily serine protease
MVDQIIGNITLASTDFANFTKTFLQEQILPPPPQVYVRLDGSTTNYQKCRIVGVNTDLDMAVLKLIDDDNSSNNNNKKKDDSDDNLPYVSFGSSSELLVGQSVVGK